MGSRLACSRPRPRPVSSLRGQGHFSSRPRPRRRPVSSRPKPRPVIMIVEKNDISHQNPIVKLTTKRLSKHKLSTTLSLSLHFSHQQATVTDGYYIWKTQAGWGVFFEPGSGAWSDHCGWILAPLVQMLLELTKLSPAVAAISEL